MTIFFINFQAAIEAFTHSIPPQWKQVCKANEVVGEKSDKQQEAN